MTREFLRELTMDGKALSKELIDAIMAEYGKGIEAVKSRFSDYEDLKAREAQSRQQWQEKYAQQEQAHRLQLQELTCRHALETAVRNHGGRNQKAIEALLDMPRLMEDPSAAEEAVAALKKDHGYLFREEERAPALSWGAGSSGDFLAPETLAGALRERFERNG